MIKKIIIVVATFLATLHTQGQEYLLGRLSSFEANPQQLRMESVSSTLSLPFIDDFSYNQSTPSELLWENRGVSVNNSFGRNPYSVGVATFDAVDNGVHYTHASSKPFVADCLTSFRIDLSQADSTSTYLSFFYQPQGNGNAPEPCDSLVLQVTSGNGVWNTIWAMEGMDYNTFRSNILHIAPDRPDTLEFALAMVPISKPEYFTSQFQFRFFNYASLTGKYNASAAINCDHWNIDFVYLNDKRSANDTLFYDIALVEPAITTLKNFTSIPWHHYTNAIETENTRLNIHLRNHYDKNIKAEVRIRIKDLDNNCYLNDSVTLGTANYDGLFNTKLVYSFDDNPIVYDNRTKASFMFECELYADKDELILGNNKCYTYQTFDNYYAYDDGTAENGYGVDATSAQVACLYSTYKPDWLTGLSICFLPCNPIESAANEFYICAWENNNGKPGKLIKYEQVARPDFSGQQNEFFYFEFTDPLFVEKNIFIGWQQISDLRLNVGWDVNRYSQNKIFYNTTGNWLSTSFSGSLMIRPVYGIKPTDIDENSTAEIKILPNPAIDFITVEGITKNQSTQINIYNSLGILVKSTTQTNINIANLQTGIYIVCISHNGQLTSKKIIKK